MKIVFMGTPDFAKESLEALYESKHEILAVVTAIDKPKGRGMKMQMSEVKEYALEKNIDIYQPEKIKENVEFIQKIKELNPDIICVVAYGKILPKEILDIPKYGCVNVHGSLLPKYRGAAPIQWAVLNGDKVTGITTIYMDEGMDSGDIILKKELEIGEDETTGEVWSKLAKLGSKALVHTLENIEQGTASREKQPSNFTIAPMMNKKMAKIDWEKQSAKQIKNLVRGLNPIMGAYTFLDNKKIKFWRVGVIEESEFVKNICNSNDLNFTKPGTVLVSDDKKGLYIKTIEGVLSVLEIQGENSKKMIINDFLRGNKIKEKEIFA